MTQTTQYRSWAALSEVGKDLTIQKSELEDSISLLLSVFDSLNELYVMLSRLNYVMERKIIEHYLYKKDK